MLTTAALDSRSKSPRRWIWLEKRKGLSASLHGLQGSAFSIRKEHFMKQLGHIATACVGAALLVRCGGLYAPGVSYPLSSSRSSTSGYQVLYNFRGAPDGISPIRD